jgi:hypothetical protein
MLEWLGQAIIGDVLVMCHVLAFRTPFTKSVVVIHSLAHDIVSKRRLYHILESGME